MSLRFVEPVECLGFFVNKANTSHDYFINVLKLIFISTNNKNEVLTVSVLFASSTQVKKKSTLRFKMFKYTNRVGRILSPALGGVF